MLRACKSSNNFLQKLTGFRSCQNNGIPPVLSNKFWRGTSMLPCDCATSFALSCTEILGSAAQGTGCTPEYVQSWVDDSPAALKEPDRSLAVNKVLFTGKLAKQTSQLAALHATRRPNRSVGL